MHRIADKKQGEGQTGQLESSRRFSADCSCYFADSFWIQTVPYCLLMGAFFASKGAAFARHNIKQGGEQERRREIARNQRVAMLTFTVMRQLLSQRAGSAEKLGSMGVRDS